MATCCRERGFLVPLDDSMIRVCQKRLQWQVLRATNPIPKFKQSDVFIQDKSGRFGRVDSDEQTVPGDDLGSGVGLSQHEKAWRDPRMDNSHRSDDDLKGGAKEITDGSSSEDEQPRADRQRVSQHSAPEPPQGKIYRTKPRMIRRRTGPASTTKKNSS